MAEHFFSKAGFAINKVRKNLHSLNLEMQPFLSDNCQLWSKTDVAVAIK